MKSLKFSIFLVDYVSIYFMTDSRSSLQLYMLLSYMSTKLYKSKSYHSFQFLRRKWLKWKGLPTQFDSSTAWAIGPASSSTYLLLFQSLFGNS